MFRRAFLIGMTCIVSVPASATTKDAKSASDITGHWAGVIRVPGAELKIDVDFKRSAAGWEADISIPAQGAKDLALDKIDFEGPKLTFVLPGVPGDPSFDGKLSADGQKITGDFKQGGQTMPFELERAARPAAAATDKLAGFEEFVEQARKDWLVPGFAMGIVVDGEIVFAKGFGKRDVESDLPVTAKTVFAIGSSSKAFTTFVLGTLVDEGKLDWDKPVVNYLPGFKLHDEYATLHMTPRDLVTHRSGLPRHDLAWYNNNSLTRKEMVGRLPYFEPNKDLREQFQYNNMMFLTAGYLTEQLTGQSWETAVRTRVFEPAGMTQSNFSVNDSQKFKDFACPYEEKDDVVKRMAFRNIDQVGPAGSINSNIEDMTKWLLIQLGNGELNGKRLVGEATLEDMHTPYTIISALPEEPELSPTSYGLGWFIRSYRGRLEVEHGGAIDGFRCAVTLYPNDGVGIVAFANLNGSPLPTLMTRHAADRILGLPDKNWSGEAYARWIAGKSEAKKGEEKKDMYRKSGTRPSHELSDFAGEFDHPGYGLFTVKVDGEKLVTEYNKIVTPFEHWHYDVFNGLENPDDHTFENLRIQFLTNLKGDVDRVAVPLEPAVDEIVFHRRPDARLSDPSYLAKFLGVYLLATTEITVGLQGKTLTLSVPGQPMYELVPDRGDEFDLKGISGFSVRFSADEKGEMTAYLNQPDAVYELHRKPGK